MLRELNSSLILTDYHSDLRGTSSEIPSPRTSLCSSRAHYQNIFLDVSSINICISVRSLLWLVSTFSIVGSWTRYRALASSEGPQEMCRCYLPPS